MTMEGFARLSLGKAHLLCQEYEDAERQLVAALEQLTLEEKKPWEEILEANRALAQALVALGKEEEANTRLERIATIEETICGDDKAA
jgi:predicted negative regulator of RcsB-dependent stress response